ncbi:inactive transglutaminase family protein [Desulfurivibrio sp. D14AmB]|uniref:inactive transglutaminase family protein n=1 Tax=Desulfurivibrio sp. D14AmB TaxID=3374370 RepID=UPI00376F37EC
MRSRLFFYLIVLALVVAGCAIAWQRHLQTQLPLLPGVQAPVWLVEVRVDFTARGEPVTVNLDIPDDPPGFYLLGEQTASPGYGFFILTENGNRRGEWSIRQAEGPQTLYYKIQLVPVPLTATSRGGQVVAPAATTVHWEEAEIVAARQLLAIARERSSNPASMTRELIKLLAASEPEQNAALLLSATPLVPLLEKLLNYSQLPTRIVNGLYLEDGRRNQQLTPKLEVFVGDRWLLFDPRTAHQGVPENFLLWNQDRRSLLDLSGGHNSHVRFAMLSQNLPAAQLAGITAADSPFALFGVHSLPVEEQAMLKMLLLLPAGALVLVFMRIMVGVQTSGTFMPILIALAFLQTTLLPGLISFVSIVAFGLLLRGYLSGLNLLLVARIATIVIIVIFIIVFSSLFGYRLGFNTGMTVNFFPIIIIAWTIERMSILWEDEGPWEVFVQGGGSLLVAVLAYLLMRWPVMAHLSFYFPEINLIIVALIMLMGNYTGYKLLELHRFRVLARRDAP